MAFRLLEYLLEEDGIPVARISLGEWYAFLTQQPPILIVSLVIKPFGNRNSAKNSVSPFCILDFSVIFWISHNLQATA